MSLEAGMELSRIYHEAVDELALHWPDVDGECIGCGDAYPCAAEWLTQRAITGIETRWRRVADQTRQLADHPRQLADHSRPIPRPTDRTPDRPVREDRAPH